MTPPTNAINFVGWDFHISVWRDKHSDHSSIECHFYCTWLKLITCILLLGAESLIIKNSCLVLSCAWFQSLAQFLPVPILLLVLWSLKTWGFISVPRCISVWILWAHILGPNSSWPEQWGICGLIKLGIQHEGEASDNVYSSGTLQTSWFCFDLSGFPSKSG